MPLRDRFVTRDLATEAARPWVADLRIRDVDAGEPIARSIVDHVSENRTR